MRDWTMFNLIMEILMSAGRIAEQVSVKLETLLFDSGEEGF
jgi:hypothetical protein